MNASRSQKLFGTDGIRGLANREPMTPATVMAVAMAAARHFTQAQPNGGGQGGPHRVVIGKDTRLSGYMLEPALTAGFVSMGMDVTLLGPLPTPAVAMLTRSLRADLGVMISASHNPYQDNGIKLFGPDGFKLSDEAELAIEQDVQAMGLGQQRELADPDKLGGAIRLEDAPGRYTEYVKATFPRGMRLDGLKIVVDCAHGAAYRVAPAVFWELGADVVAIGDQPDGRNINRDRGATATKAMRDAVIEHGADLGIALDGDADRLIMADEAGKRVDGDQLMGLIARSWWETDQLRGPGVVSTVMSNLGLERYLGNFGLNLLRTPVGDRHVVERMRQQGCNVGGEQSGHLILGDYATTGDGLIAALQVLVTLVRGGKPASELTRVFNPLPQHLRNVGYTIPSTPLEMPTVVAAIAAGEQALAGQGRLLIRKSGTEPVIRVMAEGEDESLIMRVVDDIVAACEAAGR